LSHEYSADLLGTNLTTSSFHHQGNPRWSDSQAEIPFATYHFHTRKMRGYLALPYDLHLTTERVVHSCYFQKIIKKINKNKSSRNIEISIFFV
jgi:hypothetical protein